MPSMPPLPARHFGRLVAHVDARRPRRVSHQPCCASDILACLGPPLPLAILAVSWRAVASMPDTRGFAKGRL